MDEQKFFASIPEDLNALIDDIEKRTFLQILGSQVDDDRPIRPLKALLDNGAPVRAVIAFLECVRKETEE